MTTRQSERSDERAQQRRKHIFAVNGSPDFLELLRDLLQGEEYNVTTTNFLPHTFAQIAALEPDLLIIDLAVGITAGWELLEHLRAAADMNRIPVIVVSTQEQYLERARKLQERSGRQRFIVKPFNLDDLLRAVRELIGQA